MIVQIGLLHIFTYLEIKTEVGLNTKKYMKKRCMIHCDNKEPEVTNGTI